MTDSFNSSDEFEFESIDWSEFDQPVKGVCPSTVGRLVHEGKISRVPCKLWSCPHCGKVRKQKMIKRFEHYCHPERTYRMLTLTEWKNPSNYLNSIQLTAHWNRLRASLRKHSVFLRDYFWVKEYKPLYNPDPDLTNEQNSITYPHIHCLIPSKIDTNLLRRLWYLATRSTADQVHLPEDDDPALENPAAYLTKYVTKSDMKMGFHKRERRFGFSRSYKPGQIPYKYIKYGRVKTFRPFRSDGSSIFFFNSAQASDETLLEFEEAFQVLRQEWHDNNYTDSLIFHQELQSYEAQVDLLDDHYFSLEEQLLDSNYKGDFLLSYPDRPEDKSIPYAKAKLPFVCHELLEEKMKKAYGFI